MKAIFLVLFMASALLSNAQNENDSIHDRFMRLLEERLKSMPGKKMNKFDAVSVSGIRYTSDSLTGKISLLNFWFEACSPCIAETEALNELYDKFKGDTNFRFLSLTFDPAVQVDSFVRKKHILYPVICLPDAEIRRLNFDFGFPVTILIDTTGTITYFETGGSTDPRKAKENLVKEVYPRLRELLSKMKVLQ